MLAAANMWSAYDAATLPDRATIFVALTKSTIRNSTKSGVERWRMWKYSEQQIYMNASIHVHMYPGCIHMEATGTQVHKYNVLISYIGRS